MKSKKKDKRITSKSDCSRCEGICCKNLAVEIGEPETKKEIEELRWQLHFDTVRVYLHGKSWYQLVEGKCIYLSEDNLCTIYERRSSICRKHNPPDCEFYGDYYDVIMSTPDDLDRYFEEKTKIKKKAKRKTKKKKLHFAP